MKLLLVLITCWLIAGPARGQGLEPRADRQARRELMRQLGQKTFPLVKFKDATLAECVTWLNQQGVAIEIAPESDAKPPTARKSPTEPVQRRDTFITLELKAVPASEVMKYLANLSISKIDVRNGKLRFAPLGSAAVCNYLESWEGVPPAFFGEDARKVAAHSGFTGKPLPKPNAVQAFLEKKGIRFQEGDWAGYSAESGQLIVKHSMAEVIEQIDDLIAESEKRYPKGK